MKNQTTRYEYQFIQFFNNKMYCDFSPKWRKHLKRIFPEIEDDTMIHCSKHENFFAKGDIDLRIKGSRKIISLKNGKIPCMHRERFTWFYQCLKDFGVSNKTLNMITLYQFGECQTYGHYEAPLSKEQIVEQYSNEILEANQELNQEELINMVIERAVVRGRKEHRESIDFFYYGNLEKGILLSVEQIYECIKSKKTLSDSWIHFGQLVFQPGARSRETEDYLETTIRWPVLAKLFYLAKDEDNVLECNPDK